MRNKAQTSRSVIQAEFAKVPQWYPPIARPRICQGCRNAKHDILQRSEEEGVGSQ